MGTGPTLPHGGKIHIGSYEPFTVEEVPLASTQHRVRPFFLPQIQKQIPLSEIKMWVLPAGPGTAERVFDFMGQLRDFFSHNRYFYSHSQQLQE